LPAELVCRDQFLQSPQIGSRSPELCGDDFAHVTGTIEPSTASIGAHRHAAVYGDRVDDAQWHPCLRGEHRLVQIGHQYTVDDEAGRAAAGYRKLVEPPRERDGAFCITALSVRADCTISISAIWATGLKKCRPTRRSDA